MVFLFAVPKALRDSSDLSDDSITKYPCCICISEVDICYHVSLGLNCVKLSLSKRTYRMMSERRSEKRKRFFHGEASVHVGGRECLFVKCRLIKHYDAFPMFISNFEACLSERCIRLVPSPSFSTTANVDSFLQTINFYVPLYWYSGSLCP